MIKLCFLIVTLQKCIKTSIERTEPVRMTLFQQKNVKVNSWVGRQGLGDIKPKRKEAG